MTSPETYGTPNLGAEARIAQIRSQLGKVPNGSAEWRALRIQLNEAYSAAYPGMQE